jgi:hypothetical protein
VVVADRLGRPRLRHVGGELQRLQGAGKGIFGNDYAAELEKQGLSEAEIVKKLVARDIELATESGDDQLRRRRPRREDGKVVWQREAHRAPPPAAATARTPTRPRRRPPTASGSMRRSAATSACSATARRHAAVVGTLAAAADLSRLRHGVLAGRP